MEIDSALNTVQTLKNELQDAKMAALDGQLKPLPGETVNGEYQTRLILLFFLNVYTNQTKKNGGFNSFPLGSS